MLPCFFKHFLFGDSLSDTTSKENYAHSTAWFIGVSVAAVTFERFFGLTSLVFASVYRRAGRSVLAYLPT